MEKEISSKYIALSNLKKKPFRTAAMLAVIALSSALLLGSFIISASLRGGIFGIQSRLGADLMIIPEGAQQELEGILLYGNPNYFYMDKNIEDLVRTVDGVEAASSQTYLASVSESCCDFPVQLIGFDPETDFIVKSWAKSRYSKLSSEEEVLFAGSNIDVQKKTVRFYGQTHKVTAKLAKSGSGMDSAIYTDTATLKNIFLDARSKGFGFISGDDIDKKVSAIFVKLADGVRPDSAVLRIQRALSQQPDAPAIQIIQNEKMILDLMNKFSAILIFMNGLSALVLVITFATLAVVFSLMLNERLKEFAVLRVLGASHRTLVKIILSEAGLVGCAGAVTGIFLSLLIILPFNVLISEKLALPFAMSSLPQLVLFSVLVFVIILAASILSSIFSAVRISKFEPYGDVK
ncbi:ABC transporter permease [Treponema bryantii]|uniref:ABC transporter permease n=1 Tax=Treponema bryantii TaxID=163 RepID=UPI0003B53862|nr:ABC transporter permease [Treponema bryantii]